MRGACPAPLRCTARPPRGSPRRTSPPTRPAAQKTAYRPPIGRPGRPHRSRAPPLPSARNPKSTTFTTRSSSRATRSASRRRASTSPCWSSQKTLTVPNDSSSTTEGTFRLLPGVVLERAPAVEAVGARSTPARTARPRTSSPPPRGPFRPAASSPRCAQAPRTLLAVALPASGWALSHAPSGASPSRVTAFRFDTIRARHARAPGPNGRSGGRPPPGPFAEALPVARREARPDTAPPGRTGRGP